MKKIYFFISCDWCYSSMELINNKNDDHKLEFICGDYQDWKFTIF